jgi:hypothetical protein
VLVRTTRYLVAYKFRHSRDLSHWRSGEKDLPAAKAERPTEQARWSQFQQVTLKVLRWEERDKRLVIKEAQMVA